MDYATKLYLLATGVGLAVIGIMLVILYFLPKKTLLVLGIIVFFCGLALLGYLLRQELVPDTWY